MNFPEDIFTEQEADPDTLANLGPLRRLAGIWESRTGVDVNPKAAGPERRDYSERIELQPIDAQSNGPQLLYGLRYHTRIHTSSPLILRDDWPLWLEEAGVPQISAASEPHSATAARCPR